MKTERLYLPPFEDLVAKLHMPESEALRVGGTVQRVEVHECPDGATLVIFQDRRGIPFAVPNNWRRRIIRLPSCERLIEQGWPKPVAEKFGNNTATVNYHPGCKCCLPKHYRVRDDESGEKYPVRVADCVTVGFGDDL